MGFYIGFIRREFDCSRREGRRDCVIVDIAVCNHAVSSDDPVGDNAVGDWTIGDKARSNGAGYEEKNQILTSGSYIFCYVRSAHSFKTFEKSSIFFQLEYIFSKIQLRF